MFDEIRKKINYGEIINRKNIKIMNMKFFWYLFLVI